MVCLKVKETSKKYEDICPSTHNMDVPHVKREDYQLTDISDDGYLSLMSDNGDLREDLKVPEGEVGAQLRADYDAGKDILCTVLKSCGEEVSPPKFNKVDNCYTHEIYESNYKV
ncbi:hypothetical protein NQ314_016972 [Rhamnusium bicolor]|uniref:Translation initiation factor 5A C-terminal domain-containing protein n=1 Tax=Rhamnusium bicolor TaxID=1586634 RepID=A0AAV8WUW6_9CUCU|nr:hypothetical protein NQ314_016972 [Rhamnusium bicolor]